MIRRARAQIRPPQSDIVRSDLGGTRVRHARLLARVQDRLDELIDYGELPPACTFSAGTAFFPNEGAGADALFRVADERLYESKRASAA